MAASSPAISKARWVAGLPRLGDWTALVGIVGVKLWLLALFGINEWRGSDAVGYIALADQLKEWRTWVSVPDLDTALMPISLLRIPGYALLIDLLRGLFGEAWMAAMIGAQLCASTYANFLLYQALRVLSGLWLVGIVGVGWFSLTYAGYFERNILSDSFSISLFVGAVASLAIAASGSGLRPRSGPSLIAAVFVGAFLLREANFLFAFSLMPLVWLALQSGSRLKGMALVYTPVVCAFLLIGAWQTYRTGTFFITTGGQSAPIVALAIAHTMTPILDPAEAVDGAVLKAIGGRPADEVKSPASIMETVYQVNRTFFHQGLRAPEIAKAFLRRYTEAWLTAPASMLTYAWSQKPLVLISGVSPFLYDDARLSPETRYAVSIHSQQVVLWGLIFAPIGLLFGGLVPPFRRTALIGLFAWLFAATTVIVYSSIWIEARYILHALAAALIVIASLIGGVGMALNSIGTRPARLSVVTCAVAAILAAGAWEVLLYKWPILGAWFWIF